MSGEGAIICGRRDIAVETEQNERNKISDIAERRSIKFSIWVENRAFGRVRFVRKRLHCHDTGTTKGEKHCLQFTHIA
jgi:hypothetical protein